MSTGNEQLAWKVQELEYQLKMFKDSMNSMKQLEAKVKQLEGRQNERGGGLGEAGMDTWRVEWKIEKISEKLNSMKKGEGMWSPEFAALGVTGLQLEFFPLGRETTNIAGFCSLFLWCPSGMTVRYQLGVGSNLRSPDQDSYDGRMGHGHSNFCHLESEIDKENDCVTVSVNIHELVPQQPNIEGIKSISGALQRQIDRKVAVIQNANVHKVEWTLKNAKSKLANIPRGASLFSPLFTAAGVDEFLLEFYPNGASTSTKDGYCAYYIRCPKGTKIIVTMFVGGYKKGPIAATFDGTTGKGLPDFCPAQPEVDAAEDTLTVGMELTNVHADENTTLKLE